MSDALTNSEIEDVLTSVRRLVAEDVRRTSGGSAGGRLILTPAQRIDAASAEAAGDGSDGGGDSVRLAPSTARSASDPAPIAPAKAPLTQAPQEDTNLAPAPDFRRLEATIAELEAAVSASGSLFEPDGSETTPPSNVTALYAKPSFLHTAPPQAAPPPRSEKPDQALKASTTPEAAREAGPSAMDKTQVVDTDDDEDVFETVIDEATLRTLVAQIVREELQGQLGERITLQVRKLVRSEIAKALDARDLL